MFGASVTGTRHTDTWYLVLHACRVTNVLCYGSNDKNVKMHLFIFNATGSGSVHQRLCRFDKHCDTVEYHSMQFFVTVPVVTKNGELFELPV